MKVFELFVLTKLCTSNKEAKRLINSGGASINDVKIDDINLEVQRTEDNKLVIGNWIAEDKFLVHKCSFTGN